MRNIILFFQCIFLSTAISCGSNSDTATHTMTFSFEESESADVSASTAKAIDPSSWVVRCNSVDSSGGETKTTASYDSSLANFVVTGIPDSQDTVCYLDKGDNNIVTLQYEDSNAIGDRRDSSKLTSDASAKITYTSNTDLAVVSDASGVVSSGTEDRTNYSTKWTINCTDVRNITTNEVDTSQACPSELQDAYIYFNIVMAEDDAGDLKTSYGIWTSAEAYVKCGSTEGVDNIPSGWTLDSVGTPGQGEAFEWSSPFTDFTAISTSAEILDMIRNTSESGIETYAEYQADTSHAEFCDISDDICAVRYYEDVMQDYGRGSSVCWPSIIFNFPAEFQVVASPWPDMANTTRPLSRYQYMESFKTGDMTYMHGLENQTRTVVVDGTTTNCNMRNETLIAIVSPGGDPRLEASIDDMVLKIISPGGDPHVDMVEEGTITTSNFNTDLIIESFTGTVSDNARCESFMGQTSRMVPKGFYSRAEMVAWGNPIPSP